MLWTRGSGALHTSQNIDDCLNRAGADFSMSDRANVLYGAGNRFEISAQPRCFHSHDQDLAKNSPPTNMLPHSEAATQLDKSVPMKV